MAFALGDVKRWKPGLSCTLTALAAISGKTPRQIHQVLRAAVASCGDSISDSFLADYKVKHWKKAIELLGGHWTELPTGYANEQFEDRPTISAWMRMPKATKLRLILCGSDRGEYHLFATLDNKVVDNYTSGKSMLFTDVAIPETWPDFRVIKEYYVYV